MVSQASSFTRETIIYQMASPYENMCSRWHKLPVSRTWGVTVGSRTYCQACAPRINVCDQNHTIVNEGAQPGNGDDTHNNYGGRSKLLLEKLTSL